MISAANTTATTLQTFVTKQNRWTTTFSLSANNTTLQHLNLAVEKLIIYGDPGHDLFLIKIMSRSNLIIFLEKGNIFCKMVVRNMYFLFFQLNGGGGEVISLLKENFITEPDRHTDLRPQ